MSDYSETDSDYEYNRLVIDNGTFMMKAGFAGDDAPRAVFPSIVGLPRQSVPLHSMQCGLKDVYVGDEAQCRRNVLSSLNYPIKHGVITNFTQMEKIWHHTFYNELRVAPEDCFVLLTEKPFTPKTNREQTTKIMFETFNVRGMLLINTSLLSLYASGRTSGIVLDSGGVTHAVPIHDGYTLRYSIQKSYTNGTDITNYMMKLLNKDGFSFTTNAEKEIVRDIKEKLTYVALDYDKELKRINIDNTSYELPDGQIIEFDSLVSRTYLKFQGAEGLFKPSWIYGDNMDKTKYIPVHKLLFDTIQSLFNYDGLDIKKMKENIILTGGNTMFPFLQQRLENELKSMVNVQDQLLVNGYLRNIYPSKYKKKNIYNTILGKDVVDIMYKYLPSGVKVIAPPERKYSTWIGGDVFLKTHGGFCKFGYQDIAITKDDYDETGPSIVHRKCFW